MYINIYYSILYYSISNIRIQQRLLANYVPGDTHNLQRSTGYQFARVRYYVLSYCQKYIIMFKHKTEHCFLFVLIHLIDSIRNTFNTHTQRVFEFCLTLTNKRRSCFRFVCKSWRYPESIPKLPQKVLKMTPQVVLGDPLEGKKTSNDSDF